MNVKLPTYYVLKLVLVRSSRLFLARVTKMYFESADSEEVTTEAALEALEVDGERDQIMENVLVGTSDSAMTDLGKRSLISV